MTVSKVIYFKTFPINGIYWEKVGIEIDLQPEDDTRKALYEAKRTVESFHFESNKAAEKIAAGGGNTEVDKLIEQELALTLAHIQTLEYKEDAEAYLATTGFQFNIEAKKIINSKPNKK